MKSKYIIIHVDGMEIPLVFSRFLSHENVALLVQHQIRSAGYCELNASGNWIAGGQSLSLKADARPQDADILNQQLGSALSTVSGMTETTATRSI